MPVKAAKKAMTTKKSTVRARTAKKPKAAALSGEDHERAAYLNWLNRGAPLWDDQRDWFEASLH